MARSIHIPGLVDIKKVDDKAEVHTLSLDARLDRRFESRGPLVNRFLMRRIRGALRVDGKPLPAVAPRHDAERAADQAALRHRLDPANGKPLWDEATVAALVAAVRGEAGAPEIGPSAQQAVGRLFAFDYIGDRASFKAARDLDDAVRTRNPLRAIQLYITGRLRRSRKLLSRRVNGDLAGVHATGIAVHNLVRGFEAMRDLWRKGHPRPTSDEAVGRCLFAPQTVVRQATVRGGTLVGNVRPGTLVLYQLDAIRAHTPGADAVFMAGTWAECPAVAFVPALLRVVWERAVAVEPAEKPS
jgi:hypothetical protein